MSQYNTQNPILLKCWSTINKDKSQYVKLQQIQAWTFKSLKQTNILDKIQLEVEIGQILQQYLKQQCQINTQTESIQFKFQQAIDFFNWIINNYQKQQQDQLKQVDHQNNINQNQNYNKSKLQEINENNLQKNESKVNNSYLTANKSQTQKKYIQQKQYKEYQKQQQKDQNNQFNQLEQQQQKGVQKQNRHKNQKENDLKQSRISNKSQNDNIRSISQSKLNKSRNQTQLTKIQPIKQQIKNHQSWLQYLRVIFDHYCKLSYAMGQDPTFDQIQHSSQTMTVNKFMIYCRDFNIGQLVNRNNLIDLFKKNSQYYKQMTFLQFQTVLQKISKIAYTQQDQDNLENKLSKSMVSILKFMQIDSLNNFKQKMKKLNIQYRNKGSTQIKKQPINYKFKFTPNNGKSPEQMKQQIQQRKNIRSQKKFKQKQKILKKIPQKDIVTPQLKNNNKINSFSQANGIPPLRKIPPPLQNTKLNNVTGYSQIHKLKNYISSTPYQSDNHHQKKLRLNSIVQEAKKIIQQDDQQNFNKKYQRNNSNQIRRDIHKDLYQSEKSQTNSTPYHYQKQQYHPINSRKSNKQLQIINNNQRNTSQSHLLHLLGDDQDQDYFLKQHLNRQKKSNHINKRLEKRIKQLDQVQHQ